MVIRAVGMAQPLHVHQARALADAAVLVDDYAVELDSGAMPKPTRLSRPCVDDRVLNHGLVHTAEQPSASSVAAAQEQGESVRITRAMWCAPARSIGRYQKPSTRHHARPTTIQIARFTAPTMAPVRHQSASDTYPWLKRIGPVVVP